MAVPMGVHIEIDTDTLKFISIKEESYTVDNYSSITNEINTNQLKFTSMNEESFTNDDSTKELNTNSLKYFSLMEDSFTDDDFSSTTDEINTDPLELISMNEECFTDCDYSSNTKSLFPGSSTDADRILNHIKFDHTYYNSRKEVEVKIKEEMICRTNGTISRSKTKGIPNLERKYKKEQTKDEKRISALNIPISVYDIINLPLDLILSQYDLTYNQIKCIKDVRKRGKNKIAARNCRKRVQDSVTNLADEVEEVKISNDVMKQDNEYLTEKIRIYEVRLKELLKYISSHLLCDDELRNLLDHWA